MQEGAARAPGPVDYVFGQDLVIFAVICVFLTHDIHQSAPAAFQADHLVAFTNGTHGNSPDGWIQSRHIPPTGQDANDAGFLI